MRWEVAVALALASSGCSAVFGIDTPVLNDAGLDDATDAMGTVCVGPGNFQVCVPGDVSNLTFASDRIIITDQMCPVVDAAHPTWCIYAGRNVVVSASVVATGSRPFVLIGLENLTIESAGVVDVASHHAISPGAGVGAGGGDDPQCGNAGTGMASVAGGGGGAGGTYTTNGGDGGKGSGTVGGAAAAVDPTKVLGTTLRGGCKGGSGGAGSNAADAGGAGGGAVYLGTNGNLRNDGTVNASGAGGGQGNPSKSGGSGGGAGGMIAVWAAGAITTSSGQMFANGGGGGGGADNGASGSGGGDSVSAEVDAPGGLAGGPACGIGPGCGGNGAAILGDGSQGYDDATGAGGGGGGGGLGLIRIVSGQTVDGTFSPMPI